MSFTAGGFFGSDVAENNAVSGTTASVTLPGVPTGATIVVMTALNSGGGNTATGCTDGSTYTAADGGTTSSGAVIYCYTLNNASSGSHVPVISFTGSVAGWIGALYITGSNGVDLGGTADSNFAGTGTNAVLAKSITTTANGDLLIALFSPVSGTVGTTTAGTSPAATQISTTGTYNTAPLFMEYFLQTLAGAIQMCATNSQNNDILTAVVAIKANPGVSIAWIT